MTIEEKRKEYHLMRVLLKEECGVYCVNCGSSEGIEYHHIVPLACGGNNVFTNIVPLCWECHSKAHNLKRVKKEHASHQGRPRKDAPVGYRETLCSYITGAKRGKDVKRELGLDKGGRICEQWYCKEYLESCGIERVEKRTRPNKTVLSIIYFKDGHTEQYLDGILIE